ncbi:pilus assembly protein TadG-related protein [Pseudaminobacter sp. NGMCC 1.201702]|uniref:pilus assembly protein TadG-related protein n=1 Tax=Pseudaminobacter sp. NGMCC 1.201702 TaxID=3391825 RepID=UPI0039F10FD6
MLVKRFWRSESGNFAMMFAVTLPVVLTSVGLALDVSNLMTAKSNLQNALDAAVLAASRLSDRSVSRQDAFDGYFAANVEGRHDLANAEADLKVEPGVNSIRTSATAHADVALNFAFIFGQSARVSVTSSAYESTAKLEVALVLDNTGSMGASNMKALREAATSLIETLEKEKADRPEREIRAALVPFVTAVNIKGEGFKEWWIDKRRVIPKDDPSKNGENFARDADGNRVGHWDLFLRLNPDYPTANPQVDWKGCVEARPSKFDAFGVPDMAHSLNLNDTPPDQLNEFQIDPNGPKPKYETLFVPYFAPDEPGNAAKAANSGSVYNNTYLHDLVPNGTSDRDRQESLTKYTNVKEKPTKEVYISTVAPLTSGPNYACPTPIVPLTSDLAKLKTEIGKMVYWNGSGTNVSEGLAWGFRVLSPGEPYTQGDPFDSEETSKVVVVFTDGENNVFGASGAKINKSDYGSYNYLDTNRMGSTSRNQALTNVNTLTKTMCTQLKNQNVRVFTVVLGADTAANRKLYSECATTPANYYPTKDQAQLKDAFKNIAFSISQLYVTN